MQNANRLNLFLNRGKNILVFSGKYFLIFQAVFLAIFIYRIVFRNIYPTPPFAYDRNDTFMDFFNTCYWTFQKDDTYTSWQSVYPPFAHFLCVISYVALIPNLGSIAPGTGFDWRDDPLFMTPFIIMIVIYFLSIFLLIFSRCNQIFNLKTMFLIFISMAFSVPSLFLIERGNILMYALACVNFTFALQEKRLSTLVNYLRIILIALATSIKPYLLLLIFPFKKINYFLFFLISFFSANFLALIIWLPKSPEKIFDNLSGLTAIKTTSFLVERSFYTFGISTYSLIIDLADRFLYDQAKFVAISGLFLLIGICFCLVIYNSYLFWQLYTKISPFSSNTFSFFLAYTFCIYLIISLLRESGGYAITFFTCSLIVFLSYFPKAKFNLSEFITTAYIFFYIPFLPEDYYRFTPAPSFLSFILNIPLKSITPVFMIDPIFRPLALQVFFYFFLRKIWTEVNLSLTNSRHGHA